MIILKQLGLIKESTMTCITYNFYNMKTFITIYFIIATIWTVFVMYSTLTEKFLSKSEKESLEFLKKDMSKGKWIAFLVIGAISELFFWPISIVKRYIIMPLIYWHYNLPWN